MGADDRTKTGRMKLLCVSRARAQIVMVAIVIFGMRITSAETAALAFVVLAIYAMTGYREAIRAVAVCWVFLMLNPAFAPEPAIGHLLRYFVTFAASLSVLLRAAGSGKGLRSSHFEVASIYLGAFILFHSLIISPEPAISSLKIINWVLLMLGCSTAWRKMPVSERQATAQELYLILGTLLVTSILVYPIAASRMPGYTDLFRGVMAQSQALGPTIATFAVWTFARAFNSPSVSKLALIFTSITVVFMSSSRTALLAVFAALGIAAAIKLLTLNDMKFKFPAKLRAQLSIALVFLIVLASPFAETLFARVQNFIQKGKETTSVLEAYSTSRGGLALEMWQNIIAHPVDGIGFGIASDPSTMEVKRVFGIPISAIVEKGIMPLAVIEELGIFGASFVLFWIAVLLWRSWRGGGEPFVIVLTILTFNLGEYTLFSPGGMGMLAILLIGWAVNSSRVSPAPHRRMELPLSESSAL